MWDDFIAGAGDIDALDRADAAVGGLVVLIALTTLAAAIVVSIWSLRVVGNTLTNEANFSLLNLLVVALTAFLAQRAIARVDAAVEVRRAESAAA